MAHLHRGENSKDGSGDGALDIHHSLLKSGAPNLCYSRTGVYIKTSGGLAFNFNAVIFKQRMWLFFQYDSLFVIFTTIKATAMKCLSLGLPFTMQ